ncbi:outer membrane beta-barrel family protein [Myroides sp. WP-1]|uniref:outer membrane beta-barrel family protein n=1 Tax=Myroides sp. WP-1 TaxID=2759944 RepID=UPI0015FA16BA|nr:outer membrane beta-barrel family protein [Myroides sp. WP-1]MBB1139845.1 TonB-dependent receptor [Myroides sp. WP-1]
MKYYFVIITLFFSLIGYAQHQLSGQLITSNGGCVSYGVVELYQGDSLIQRVFTDEQGYFVIKSIVPESYTLYVSSIYFKTAVQTVLVDQDLVLLPLILQDDPQQLEELVIETKQKPITQTDEGILLRVSETRLKNQPDVLSILNYAPNISTTDGIKILESDEILVQVDGKDIRIDKSRIATFLETLNPSIIDEIEIVDRVDGSIEGEKRGIIRITTIQNEGWTGNIRQNTSYNDKWGYSTDASLFYERQKFRVFGNYYHARHKTFAQAKGVLEENIETLHYANTEKSKVNRKSDYLTIGADYQLDENSSFSLLYLFEDDKDDDHQRTVLSTITGPTLASDSLILSRTFFDQVNKMHSSSLSYTSNLDTLGSKFTVAFDFATKKYFNPFAQQNEYQKAQVITREQNTQNAKARNVIYVLNAQWQKKYTNQKTLTLGTRVSWINNKDYFHFVESTQSNWSEEMDFSNNFCLKEYIYSTFANLSLPMAKKSKLTVGIRAEYNYNDFSTSAEKGNNNNFRVLPNLNYNTTFDGSPFYISASQRLSRPSYALFNTTYVKDSPISASRGNDKLKPTDIYSLQMGYRLRNNISLNWRYNYVKNNIVILPSNVKGIVVTNPINAGYRNDLFAFISWPYTIANWWEISTKATGAYLNFKLPDQKFSSLYANLNINNTWHLFRDMELNVDYSYTSAYRVLYTKIKQVSTVNCTVYYPLSPSFSLIFGVNDLFDSLQSRHEYNINDLYSYTDQRYNSRSYFLSIKYNFNRGKEVEEDIRSMEIEEVKGRY